MASVNELIVNLPEYIEQNREQLYIDATAPNEITKWLDVMLGVKHAASLATLSSEVALHAAECGWNPGGSDTISDKLIEVQLVEVEKQFCYLSDLKETYANYQYRWAAGLETLPFEQKFAESNVAAVRRALNELVWKGDSGLSITGLIADVEDTDNIVDFASGDTAVAKVDAMVASLSAKMLRKGVRIFMSMTDFRNYVLESNGTCCANRPVLDAASESITYAGDSRVILVPMEGLEGTDVMVAGTPDSLVYATDIAESEARYDFWFERKEQAFMFRILFAAGTAVRYDDEVRIGEVGE